MNAYFSQIAFVLAALGTVGAANAQQMAPARVSPRATALYSVSAASTPYPHYGFYPGRVWCGKAATVGESYARGQAAIIHAQSQYNLAMAHVRAMETETRQRQLEYYYNNKQVNGQYRDSVRKSRASSGDAARFATVAKPKELSPVEVDAQTGAISWPVVLQSARFADYRAELERLFAQIVTGGELAANEHHQLLRTADAMQAELEKVVREVKPMEYVEAKRFVEALAFQAQQG